MRIRGVFSGEEVIQSSRTVADELTGKVAYHCCGALRSYLQLVIMNLK